MNDKVDIDAILSELDNEQPFLFAGELTPLQHHETDEEYIFMAEDKENLA